MLNALLSAILQVALTFLIAWVVYLVMAGKRMSFSAFIGLTATPAKAVLIGAMAGLTLAAGILAVPGSIEILAGEGTVTGDTVRRFGGGALVAILAVTAVFKTSLAEEVLFRGLIGKQLIRKLGFPIGNLMQAMLFGLVHLVLLLAPTVNAAMVAFAVVMTGALGWFNGWLNERLGGGSILPGWAAHASANLTTFLGVAFLHA